MKNSKWVNVGKVLVKNICHDSPCVQSSWSVSMTTARCSRSGWMYEKMLRRWSKETRLSEGVRSENCLRLVKPSPGERSVRDTDSSNAPVGRRNKCKQARCGHIRSKFRKSSVHFRVIDICWISENLGGSRTGIVNALDAAMYSEWSVPGFANSTSRIGKLGALMMFTSVRYSKD